MQHIYKNSKKLIGEHTVTAMETSSRWQPMPSVPGQQQPKVHTSPMQGQQGMMMLSG